MDADKKHDETLEKYFLRLFEYQRKQRFKSIYYIIDSITIYELLSKYIYIQGQKRIIYIDNLLQAIKEYKEFYLESTKSLLSTYGITLNSHSGEPSEYNQLSKIRRTSLNRGKLVDLYLKNRIEKLKHFEKVEKELAHIKAYSNQNSGINFVQRTVWYIYLLDIFIDETFFGAQKESEKAIQVLTKHLPKENDTFKSIKIPTIEMIIYDTSNVDWSRTPNAYTNPYYNFVSKKFNINSLKKNYPDI
jgi:hypothetical protein